MNVNNILRSVKHYYDDKLNMYGATSKGVDWNSPESQTLRFKQLLKVCEETSYSINDYGCGYSALVDYLVDKDYVFKYCGFDISDQMIAKANELYGNLGYCQFTTDESLLMPADYTVASGIFNVKLETNDDLWEKYILHTLEKIAAISAKGFAFNMLTKYSDPERMRPDLYYADPLMIFDHCKKNFSKFVSLLHDYPLFEFTIIVRT